MADPDATVPPRLRRYIGFTRVTDRALRDVWRTLDEDDDLRVRAVRAVEADGGPESVGEAGWLLLSRPEGWQEQLDTILARASDDAQRAREEQAEAKATRQLARLSKALAAAEVAQEAAAADASAAREALAAERASRVAVDLEVADLRAELAEVTRDRADAVRKLKRAEDRLAERAARQRDLEADLALARERLDRLERSDAPAAGHDDVADDPLPPAVPPDPDIAPVETEPWTDPAAVRDRLDAAGRAAASLGAALEDLARLVGGGPAAPGHAERAGGPSADEARRAGGSRRGGAAAGGSRARRPIRIPVGVFDDSPDAAAVLLREPGVVALVDGWNVSMAGWPDLDKDLQRHRLVEALRDLERTTGARFVVVFDSALDERSLPSASLLRSVQVRFAPVGVTADEELLAAIDALPDGQSVVLVTADRAVQDGARVRGANVVPTDALLALL